MIEKLQMEINPRRHVVVIGGGIAGLSCAYYLRKHGIEVSVFERNSSSGGHMRSALADEKYLLEYGPNSFLPSAKPIFSLARELSIDSQIISNSNKKPKRFILKNGKLVALPTGPRAFLTSDIMSFSGKLRLLTEPWVKSRSENDESLASFVRRRAGEEVLENLVNPFVSGVYAGDSEQLSAASVFPKLIELEQSKGSVLKGMKSLNSAAGKQKAAQMYSFRWGMGTLSARLEEVLHRDLRLQTCIEAVDRLPNGRLTVRVEAPRRSFEADAVVIAAPAWVASRIAAPLLPEAISPLMSIPYVPLTVVHTAFKRSQMPHSLDGFGFLVPCSENVRLLGSIWPSSLFCGRCPRDEVLLTNYIGGATDTSAVELEDHELLSHVLTGLEKATGVQAEPTFAKIQRLNQAIPQYNIGHQERLQMIMQNTSQQAGLFLTGNYFSGVSVADTIEHARSTADNVLAHLGVWSP